MHRVISHWNWPSLLQVRRLARELELDVIDIQYQAAAYGMTPPIHFLPRVTGVTSLVTFHDLRVPYLFPKAGRLRRRAVLGLARGADGAIVTNPEDEATLMRAGGVRRIARVPIGSNIAPELPADYSREEWRRRLGFAPDDFLIGYFGFLNASKGGEILIGALAKLAAEGRPAHLLLIGGRTGTSDPTNADYGDQVDALARDLGVELITHRTGFVTPPEVSAHLTACDAVVLPYRDGVSFRRGSFMAALAHGCAIVSTAPAVPLSELRDSENIRLVPPDDPVACAAAIAELRASPELRRRLSQGARSLAMEFTWDKIAARTVDVFRAVCRANRGERR
ncbi:MAG: glycosyltransferase family 4 protein [Chloroflexi bacterium]|nr:glycosyltransferase family 4 protein [Chloroflexota bacterium]